MTRGHTSHNNKLTMHCDTQAHKRASDFPAWRAGLCVLPPGKNSLFSLYMCACLSRGWRVRYRCCLGWLDTSAVAASADSNLSVRPPPSALSLSASLHLCCFSLGFAVFGLCQVCARGVRTSVLLGLCACKLGVSLQSFRGDTTTTARR